MLRRVGEVMRWARANDWRPRHPRTRRDGQFTWTNEVPDPGSRKASTIRVIIDAGGVMEVWQRMTYGWVNIAIVHFGAWQAPIDVLAALYVLPHEFSTAWKEAREVKMTLQTQLQLVLRALLDNPMPKICGDWPAPCNCDDPLIHNGH
jgi:hypothetical protein